MITPVTIYLITIIDKIGMVSTLLASISVVLLIFCSIGYSITKAGQEYDTARILRHTAIATAFTSVFFCVISLLCPTKKEMAAMIVIPKIANSEKIQESAGNMVDLANAWMKELMHKPLKEMKQ